MMTTEINPAKSERGTLRDHHLIRGWAGAMLLFCVCLATPRAFEAAPSADGFLHLGFGQTAVSQRERPSGAVKQPPEKTRRALWVWSAEKLLLSPQQVEELEKFFRFCTDTGIQEIYFSLALSFQSDPQGPRVDLRHPAQYRSFIERAHRQGMEVEALAGSPEWATRTNHPFPLAAVDAVLTFNHSVPLEARFDGVHFDVEPYSLPGFFAPATRSQLLVEFLEMISRSAARLHSESKLRMGCDVPAWFYPAAGPERQKLLVRFNGAEKTIGEHLTDLLETVTIMDYHDRASGAGGIIALGIPPLEYAASQGKKIVVGIETSVEPESLVYFIGGLPVTELGARLSASDLGGKLFFGDFRLATWSNENQAHLGLVAPSRLEGATRQEFERALIDLANKIGVTSTPEGLSANSPLDRARVAIEHDPEWKAFEAFKLIDPETHREVAGFHMVHQTSPQSTFHYLARESFEKEMNSVLEGLSHYTSFGGVAFHFYESYRSLMEHP